MNEIFFYIRSLIKNTQNRRLNTQPSRVDIFEHEQSGYFGNSFHWFVVFTSSTWKFKKEMQIKNELLEVER